MKKGFSLVELSIVLVIIGILMGMTIKGKSLIDAARIRSDLATVNKIKVAVAAYVVDVDDNFTDNITARLHNAKLLDNNSRKFKFADTVAEVVPIITNDNNQKWEVITSGFSRDAGIQFGDSGKARVIGCIADSLLDDGINNASDARADSDSTATADLRSSADCRAIADPKNDLPEMVLLVF